VYSKASDVKVSTGSYNVYKQYSNEPAPKRDGTPAWTPEEREKNAYWQAQQVLQLDGADKDAVLNLVASLQKQGFAVQNMNFYLSREASDKLRDELTAEALATIKTRAESMARTLNMKSIRYARIDTSGGGMSPMPMARNYAMKAEMAMAGDAMSSPVGQAGESDVQLTVSAEVRLK
jgi:predicted secreted protein